MIPLLFSKSVYSKRREALVKDLVPNRDLLVFFSSPERARNHDSHFRYRPDSSSYYLTGLAEPETTFFLWKEKTGKITRLRFHVFVLPRDAAREQWDGYRYGPSRTKALVGADFASSNDQFGRELLKWLFAVPGPGQAPRIFTNAKQYSERESQLTRMLAKFNPPHRSGKLPVESISDISTRVGSLRLIKDAGELTAMREASRINVAGHLRVMHNLRPGLYEYEAQAMAEAEYLRNGCLSTAYTSICASGVNATILHYNDNSRRMKAGELFLIDAGCEHNFFASDVTRTLPVSGRYTPDQRLLMNVVASAHAEALRIVRPGIEYTKIHETAEDVLIEGLQKLRILKGTKKQIKQKLSHKRYYPHGTSHWLGLDVHDACPYRDEQGKSLKLKAGMVFTIEPGLYFLQHDKSVDAKWRGLGIRIEDDVAVTKRGSEVLTAQLPRTADEVESEMN